jgi:hypothetical protein
MAVSLLPAQREHSTRLLRSSLPLKLSRDLREIPVERYRLPKDGRKWKAIARDRMSLAGWLATHGDGDGSRIYPSVRSMVLHFGWSRAKTFYLLDDLKKLHLLEPAERDTPRENRATRHNRGPLTSEHGTRVRRMNLPAFLGAEVQDSQNLQKAEVQDSMAEVQSKFGPNRHPTDTKSTPPTPPLARGAEISFFFVGRDRVEVTFRDREQKKLFRRFWTKARSDSYIGAQGSDVVDRLKSLGLDAKVSC